MKDLLPQSTGSRQRQRSVMLFLSSDPFNISLPALSSTVCQSATPHSRRRYLVWGHHRLLLGTTLFVELAMTCRSFWCLLDRV